MRSSTGAAPRLPCTRLCASPWHPVPLGPQSGGRSGEDEGLSPLRLQVYIGGVRAWGAGVKDMSHVFGGEAGVSPVICC